MAEVSSITRVGTTEPFSLQVARGQVGWHETIFKFGYNADIDNSLETVWSLGGQYTYLSSASTVYVSSSSTDDTSAGTGAQSVTVRGLDANFDEQEVTVSTNGQSGVQVGAASNWIRVNRVSVETAGSGEQNAGNIHVGTESSPTSGVPATSYGYIAAGDNQSLMALWTVPRGYTAYLSQTNITAACTSSNKLLTVSLVARSPNNGSVFKVMDRFGMNIGGARVDQVYDIPLKFETKTDIEVRAITDASSANAAVSAGLDFLYIQNRPYPE